MTHMHEYKLMNIAHEIYKNFTHVVAILHTLQDRDIADSGGPIKVKKKKLAQMCFMIVIYGMIMYGKTGCKVKGLGKA